MYLYLCIKKGCLVILIVSHYVNVHTMLRAAQHDFFLNAVFKGIDGRRLKRKFLWQ